MTSETLSAIILPGLRQPGAAILSVKPFEDGYTRLAVRPAACDTAILVGRGGATVDALRKIFVAIGEAHARRFGFHVEDASGLATPPLPVREFTPGVIHGVATVILRSLRVEFGDVEILPGEKGHDVFLNVRAPMKQDLVNAIGRWLAVVSRTRFGDSGALLTHATNATRLPLPTA